MLSCLQTPRGKRPLMLSPLCLQSASGSSELLPFEAWDPLRPTGECRARLSQSASSVTGDPRTSACVPHSRSRLWAETSPQSWGPGHAERLVNTGTVTVTLSVGQHSGAGAKHWSGCQGSDALQRWPLPVLCCPGPTLGCRPSPACPPPRRLTTCHLLSSKPAPQLAL